MTKKQTILIAGATGNNGGGTAVALAKRGARVVLLGRKFERLEARAVNRFPKIDGLILSVVALIQNGPNILPK